jgi:hypothetical protein
VPSEPVFGRVEVIPISFDLPLATLALAIADKAILSTISTDALTFGISYIWLGGSLKLT